MARPASDIAGQRFGKLVAKHAVGSNEFRQKMWHCECDCGNTIEWAAPRLLGGQKSNCGCVTSREPKAITAPEGFYTIYQIAAAYEDCGLNKAILIARNIEDFPEAIRYKHPESRKKIRIWPKKEVDDYFRINPASMIKFSRGERGRSECTYLQPHESYFSNPLLGLARMFYQSLNHTIYAQCTF